MGMLAFMMWMSGSQVHLFSIMMTVSGIYQPLMAIVKSGEGMLFLCILNFLRTVGEPRSVVLTDSPSLLWVLVLFK